MKKLRLIQVVIALALLFVLLVFRVFEKDNTTNDISYMNNEVTAVLPAPITEPVNKPEPEIENKSYLFDVSNHTIEELEALLVRAEEVSQAQSEEFNDLEIVMILHGPDIDWFTHKNMEKNKKLVELAAKLDAYDVIDMKVCEKTLQKRGVAKDDLPAFIEPVPYAPTAIDSLLKEGYINL